MLTYQDLVEVGEFESDRMAFILEAISKHEQSELYKTAMDADDYYRHRNPTIMRYQKFVYNQFGKAVPDIYSANNKIPCRFYNYFVTQEVQYLLGNGVSFSNDGTKEKLGKGFDSAVQKAATMALNGSVSFGFWNNDHLEVFGVSKGGTSGCEPVFIPLYDEENGALRAGIRYWRIDDSKPLRATLYEESGYTEYIKREDEDMLVLQEKRPYKLTVRTSEIGGTEILSGENYPTFPIIPLWNTNKQSELIGGKETIDAYDLMASALVNNVDEGNLIYWVLKNCGGMDDLDDAKFVERLKTTHVAHADGDDGAQVESHSVEAPYQANEVALDRLKKQMFTDYMALDVSEIAGGAVTATQIMAAYEPLNSKTDQFEYCVTEFIEKLLALIGIEDTPTYTRSVIVNQTETIQTILQAAEYLDEDYVTTKILELFGDSDKADEIIQRRMAEETTRFANAETETEEEE